MSPRHRGVAMLLVLIAVAMATILSMSFLASQSTTHGVSQNVQKHAQARSVAESALVAAIHYVQTDTDFRTDKAHGQWASGVSFNGGTFDVYGYDGLDTDDDGVVDDTDGDLTDDDSDPVTLTVVGFYDGVSHRVNAVVTPGSTTSAGTILYVLDSIGINALDQTRIDLMEEWGFNVVLIGENESQGNFNTAISDNEVDVVYVRTLIGNSVGAKIQNLSIGVVTEEGSLYDELLLSTGDSTYASTDIDITDNTHYITNQFSTGALTIATMSNPMRTLGGAVGAGVSALAEQPSSSAATLSVLDIGDTGHDSTPAPGRRVALPWNGTSIQWNLNADGETIMRRALTWAATDAGSSGGTYDYATRTQGTDIWAYAGQESSGPPSNNASPSSELSAGEYDDIETDDSDSHSINTSSNNRHSTMRFVIQIDEDEADVTSLGATFIGSNYNEHGVPDDGVIFYIWNYTSGDYEVLEASADTESEVTLTGTIASNITDYIGGASDDTVILLAQSADRQLGNRDNILYCNYVSLSVNTGASSGSGPQLIALYEFQEVTQPPTIVGQWKLDDTQSPILYDFDTGMQGVNVWAYDGQSSTDPPNDNSTPSSQLNILEYPDIENDDSDSHSVNTSSNNSHSMMRYVFRINEDESDVKSIDVEWIGRNDNEHGSRDDGVELFIWNYSTGSYEELDDSGDTDAWVTLTGSLTANLTDYIGGASDDTITLLAQSRDRQTGNRDNILYCDYVSVTLNDVLIATDSQDDNDGVVTGDVTGNETGMGDGGTAFRFDGSGDLITIPADPTLNFPDDFSLSGWFKLDNNFNSSTGTTQILVAKHIDNDYNMILALAGTDYNRISVPSGRMVFKIEGGDSSVGFMHYVWTARSNWTAGQWYHFTAVLDSNYAPNNKIYIDGVDDSAGSENGAGSDALNLAFNADVTIGGGSADSGQLSGDRYFDGVIDDVRLVGQVLTDSQIAELAAVTEPSPDSVPIAYDTSGYGAPLDLEVQVPSNVTWVPGGGLTFDTTTRLISPAVATKLYSALTATNQFSVEVRFTPTNTSQSGPARIVSYSGGSSDTNVTFGQDGQAYVGRLDTTSTTAAGTPEADSGNMLSAGVEEHVIISYDGENITMYNSDGSSTTLARTGDLDWDNTFDLLMGNEAVDGYGWLGTLSRVAIYDQAFNQTQANNVFDGLPPGDGTSGAGGVNWIEP